jgi:hypothetical protein
VNNGATPAPMAADPPPWAPAYGYRKKHGDHERDVVVVERSRPSCVSGYRRTGKASNAEALHGCGSMLGSVSAFGSEVQS